MVKQWYGDVPHRQSPVMSRKGKAQCGNVGALHCGVR